MARVDIEFTKTYEEYDGAFRPIDRTMENIEKTKRDGDLVQIVVLGLVAIIVVFLLVGALIVVLLNRPVPHASMIPPCTESALPITASLPPREAGISPMIPVSTNDGFSMDSELEQCSVKTVSSSSTSTEEKMPPEPSGEITVPSVPAPRKLGVESMHTLKAKPPREGSRLVTSRAPVTWCRRRAW